MICFLLPFPDHFFLSAFFALVLAAVLPSGSGFESALRSAFRSAFGFPLTALSSFSFWISSSDKSYKAITPLYPDALYPARFNLLWVVATVTGFFRVLIIRLISATVNSIPSLYRQTHPVNQVGKCLYVQYIDILDIWTYRRIDVLLYSRIVFFKNFSKFSWTGGLTLDEPPGRGYSINVYMSICLYVYIDNKNGNGVTGSRKGPKGAKGDFYEERTEKFGGMA